MTPTKSFTERVFQALGFEGLALLICTPLLVWITGRPALEMGAVTLGISLLALSWNVVFNSLFDRLKNRLQLANGGWTRVLHALLLRKNSIVARAQIEEALYGWGDEVESNAIEVYIHNLRKKFGADSIVTVRGLGYRLKNDDTQA